MLITEFLAFAVENGASQVELKVVSDNLCAIRLYEKLAFAETKKYMQMKL